MEYCTIELYGGIGEEMEFHIVWFNENGKFILYIEFQILANPFFVVFAIFKIFIITF